LPKAPEPVPYPEENYVEAPRVTTPTPTPAPSLPQYTEPVVPSPIAPSAPQRTAPDASPDGGEVTLTIKGPIHVAGYSDDVAKPRFIQERLDTTK